MNASHALKSLSELSARRAELLRSESDIWLALSRALAELNLEKSASAPISDSRPPAQASSDRPLSVREAAEVLGLAPATLNNWRLKGGGPKFVRLGRRIFYRRDVLEDFIKSKTYAHTSAYPVDS